MLPLTLPAQRLCLSEAGPRPVPLSKRSSDSLLHIPIVFHNIYRTSDQLVSLDQVNEQLEVINADFQRLNPDTMATPPEFRSVAADCQISFCLASIDPFGDPTLGLNQVETLVREIGLSDRYHQSNHGGQTIWNPSAYLNVWICEIDDEGSVAGFANGASQSFRIDEGVVIDYRFFSNSGGALPPFDGGRTLTHEIGHYLGLKHIWGDSVSCATDDGLLDTPVQLDAYEGCPDLGVTSCGTADMFMNFMDLTDDACMNMFTVDQKELMRAVLIQKKPMWAAESNCRQTVGIWNLPLSQIQITPNPASHRIHFATLLENIQIYSAAGQVLEPRGAWSEIDVSHLPTGVYCLRGKAGSNVYFARFMKL